MKLKLKPGKQMAHPSLPGDQNTRTSRGESFKAMGHYTPIFFFQKLGELNIMNDIQFHFLFQVSEIDSFMQRNYPVPP